MYLKHDYILREKQGVDIGRRKLSESQGEILRKYQSCQHLNLRFPTSRNMSK